MEDNLPDNRVDIFYVANKLVEILEVEDKDLRREVEEFRSEIFHNIGANAVYEQNN
jgi:hypothetical protein|tara:strand:+ start:169 stop:336 length:168 start_codon:yes stop_codon:yes gene_type:complete